MDRHEKIILISRCLDRYDRLLTGLGETESLTVFRKNRLNRLMDLDVSKADIGILYTEGDCDFLHDIQGLFAFIERNPDEPEKSIVGSCFVPRCGFAI